MALTLAQIAKIAGVSRSTASRVINERPGVRPAVRERVWQVIGEYDYEPNNNARLLANRRFRNTGSDQQTVTASK